MTEFIENLTLIWVGGIGLFIISLMLFSSISNKMVNIYLVITFVLCSVRNIILGTFDVFDSGLTFNSKILNPIFLAAVPCLFLYFKSLVEDYRNFRKKDLIHFIIPAFILILNITQDYLSLLNYWIIEDIRFLVILGFLIFYSIASYRVLNGNLWKQNETDFFNDKHFFLMKNWTRFVFIISSLMYLRIIYSICVEKIVNEPLQAAKFSLWAVIPWLLIYGRILITPEILYGCPKLKSRSIKRVKNLKINNLIWIYDLNTLSNSLDENEYPKTQRIVLSYILDLENYIFENHPFRNKNFSSHDLADILKIPDSHLHFIFKYYSVISFKEFQESSRVNDAKQLLDKGNIDISDLNDLSVKVGFSELSDFVSSFLKFTGYSPAEYAKNLKLFRASEFIEKLNLTKSAY